MAFALCLPSMGYYTFATYANLIPFDGSGPAIVIRALALVVVIIAFAQRSHHSIGLPSHVLPGVLFLVLYFLRMLENVWLQNMAIPPNTGVAFLNYTFSLALTSLLLAVLWHGYSSRDARVIFSTLAGLFIIGALLNIQGGGVSEKIMRLAFEKVNPISLAYTCSTFILYYIIIAQKSRFAAFEAIVIVPFLLFFAMQAKSRGMIISTASVIVLYFVLLRGGRRIVMLSVTGLFGIIAAYSIDWIYFENLFLALERINTSTDMSTALRVSSFRGAYEQFLSDPLLGRYVNEKNSDYYPHNIYLESLMAVGILGSTPFVLHLVFSSVASLAILRMKDVDWIWTLVALIFLREAIGSAASGSIWGNNGFWITSFMTIAMWFGRRNLIKVGALAANRRLSKR